MKWIKRGLIYKGDEKSKWTRGGTLTPQPFLINDDTIRVYISFLDGDTIGRIGYLDLAASNPKVILGISRSPVLDIGSPGQFDDNGVILGDVLRVGDSVWMYYEGFQKVNKVKFFAFTGVAVSRDNGSTFSRYSRVPVMDRSEEGIFGRCIHSVIFDGKMFKVWYSTIHSWYYINGLPYPSYHIKYIESEDGLTFGSEGALCIRCKQNEYRIGRPKVTVSDRGVYEMLYTVGTCDNQWYNAGYAKSLDGLHWERDDDNMNVLTQSATGFDNKSVCYPVVITTKYGSYMFYDGNGMGREGFGYAELIEE